MKTRVARLVATWFGCGYAPVGPGTVGSLAAALMAWALGVWGGWPPWAIAALGAAIAIPGTWAAAVTARAERTEDPGIVVIDEVAGQWIAFAGAGLITWKSVLAALLLFRLFDIWKPPPVRQLEKLPEGFGVMADDAFAGVYAAVLLYVASRVLNA
jgi:phosphatidylglycerophosphatase A